MLNTEVRNHYNRQASDYESRWSAYLASQTNWVLEHWLLSDGSVLDLGCGTGAMLSHIGRHWPNLSLTGVDLSHGMLLEAQKNVPGAVLLEGSLEDTSFSGRLPQSDIVLSLSVLHHLNDIDRHLRLLAKLVKPAGTIFLSAFARDGLLMSLAEIWFRLRHPHYHASLAHADIARKVKHAYPNAEIVSAILRPDWFWRIQIFRVHLR